MKNLLFFGQGKEVSFDLESRENYPFSTILSVKKGGFLTKSQGKFFARFARIEGLENTKVFSIEAKNKNAFFRIFLL